MDLSKFIIQEEDRRADKRLGIKSRLGDRRQGLLQLARWLYKGTTEDRTDNNFHGKIVLTPSLLRPGLSLRNCSNGINRS